MLSFLFKFAVCVFIFPVVLNAKELTYTGTKHFDEPSAFITVALSQKLFQQGFHALDQSNKGMIPLLNMDQVYKRNDQVIFFKQGIRVKSQYLGKVMPIAGGFVYHGNLLDVPVAIFFDKFSEDQVKGLLKKSELMTSFNIALDFSIMPKACASGVTCQPVTQNYQNIAGISQLMNINNYILKLAPTCAISALQGVKNGVESSVETIAGLGRSIKSFFEDPRKLWLQVKKTYSEVEDLIKNFVPRMSEFLQSMSELIRDPEIAGQVICSTLSSIIVQAAIGGGLVKGAIVITQTFLKLEKIKSLMMTLLSLKRRNHNTDHLTGKLISCAL